MILFVRMIQQRPLPNPVLHIFLEVFAWFVPHGQQHQAQRPTDREREPALKRLHASQHNYPLCIETPPPSTSTPTHTHMLTLDFCLSRLFHRFRFLSLWFCLWNFIQALTPSPGRVLEQGRHRWITANVVHITWNHQCIMEIQSLMLPWCLFCRLSQCVSSGAKNKQWIPFHRWVQP